MKPPLTVSVLALMLLVALYMRLACRGSPPPREILIDELTRGDGSISSGS